MVWRAFTLIFLGLFLLPTSIFAQDEVEPEPAPPIFWSKGKPLKWDDFKGKVPEDAPEDLSAKSTIGVFSFWEFNNAKCEEKKGGKWFCTLTLKSVVSQARFDPNTSWVKSDDKSDDLLKHEQGHFNISEVFARKKKKRMENFLDNKMTGTGNTAQAAVDDAKKKFEKILHGICDAINKEESAIQDLYDTQTKHGKDEKQQKKWDEKIAKMLKES